MDQEEVDIFECLYDLISQVCANVSDDSCFEDEVDEKDSEDEIKQFIEGDFIYWMKKTIEGKIVCNIFCSRHSLDWSK